MKKFFFSTLLLGLIVFAGQASAGGFTLSSPQIQPGGTLPKDQIFNSFGCTGNNISPRLEWKNPPKGTKSFAVTVYDPDAPTGSGWWHWVLFDIPADTHSLELSAGNLNAGKAPKGSIQSLTDFGVPGYGGACPPAGDKPHRYIFTVFALDTPSLGLDAKAMPALVGFSMNGKILGKATLTGVSSR
ncbi:MAG: YbhB/YbcL family Raf kinase inhibitor-like protein [Bilophila sp.]